MRALRRAEPLGEDAAAFVCLAETTPALLDAALVGDDKAYSVALVARSHRDPLSALYDHAEGYAAPDKWDTLLAEVTTPTPGTPDDGGTSRMG